MTHLPLYNDEELLRSGLSQPEARIKAEALLVEFEAEFGADAATEIRPWAFG